MVSSTNFDGVYFTQGGRIISSNDLAFERRATLVPRHMLVTGVGRGGTTACASILSKFGFVTEQATPYLESERLREFILKRDVSGALAELEKWPAEGPRMFWKDPKLWVSSFDPFLADLPQCVGLIVAFRDPLNIAARNAVAAAEDLLVAIERAARAAHRLSTRLTIVRDRNVALVSYEKLLVNPEAVVSALARFVQVDDPERIATALASIEPTPHRYHSLFKPATT